MDFKGFFIALVTDWVALISGIGSVVMLILSFTLYRKKRTPRWIVLSIAVICFFFAGVKIWTTEHVKYLEEANKNMPKLEGEIEQIGAGTLTDKHGKDLFPWGIPAIITVTITNTGAQSIAHRWRCTIKTADGREVVGENEFIPPDVTVGQGQQKRHLSGKDALYNKAMTPIPQGGAITGLLMFTFRGVTQKEFFQQGTLLTLEFQDVLKKKSFATYSPTALRPGYLYIPGTESPLTQRPTESK